jgi:hypothetical protein
MKSQQGVSQQTGSTVHPSQVVSEYAPVNYQKPLSKTQKLVKEIKSEFEMMKFKHRINSEK